MMFISSVLAYIGLGLVLWGVLLSFIRPTKYVKLDIFDSTLISSLKTVDKILTELQYKGQGVYLPPRSFTELEESLVYVSLNKETSMPKSKEIKKGKLFMNPKGIFLMPSGQGLLNLYEKELGTDLSITDINYLKNNFPQLLVEDLEILEDIEISEQDDTVYVRMKSSVFEGICNYLRDNTSVCSRLGCPLCSSLACAIAKATDKAVVIDREYHSKYGKKIEVWFRLIKP
jgi:hypothetical protein